MPVPASINDLSTTAASNSPGGGENPFPDLDNHLRAFASFIAYLRDNKLNSSAVSAFILTLLDDTDAATARATLGAVGLTGSETVAGVKTFSSSPVVPTATTSGQAANKGQVDLKLDKASNLSDVANAATALTNLGGIGTSAFTGSNQTLATSGEQKFPGGLILKWGRTGAIANGGYVNVNYPTGFPTASLPPVTSPVAGGQGTAYAPLVFNHTNAGFSVGSNGSAYTDVVWYALGW